MSRIGMFLQSCFISMIRAFRDSILGIWRFMVDMMVTIGVVVLLPASLLLGATLLVLKVGIAQR
jgi:hypothetical protein